MESSKSIMISALQERVGDITVSSRIPEDKHETFITVSRIGGGRGSFGSRNPRFLIEVFSIDEDYAEELAEQIELILPTIQDSQIVAIRPDKNLVEYSDLDTDYTKFQLTAEMVIKLAQKDFTL